MKPLYIKKTGIWLTVLLTGVVLVAAGLFQLATGVNRGADTGRQGTALTGTAKGNNTTEARISPKTDSGKQTPADKQQNTGGLKTNEPDGPAAKQNEFFVEYRLERDRIRSQNMDLYREIVNNQNSPEETRKEAQRRLLAISQAIDVEMKLENLIKAENFKDVVVFMEEKSATVIVQAPMLTPLDKNKVTEITARVTGLPAESILIKARV